MYILKADRGVVVSPTPGFPPSVVCTRVVFPDRWDARSSRLAATADRPRSWRGVAPGGLARFECHRPDRPPRSRGVPRKGLPATTRNTSEVYPPVTGSAEKFEILPLSSTPSARSARVNHSHVNASIIAWFQLVCGGTLTG